MYNIKCPECGSTLIVDEQLTKEYMWTDDTIYYNEAGVIIEATIKSELVYRCLNCEQLLNLDYKSWEKLAREQIADELIKVKRLVAFKTTDPYEVDQDKGFEFCGCCPGYDDLGNCFTSLIATCKIRKQKVG